MVEETPTPVEPPDIRPFGCYPFAQHEQKHKQQTLSSTATHFDRINQPRHNARRGRSYTTICYVVGLLCILACIPIAAGQHVEIDDVYTSLSSSSTTLAVSRRRPTPILTLLNKSFRYLSFVASDITGYGLYKALDQHGGGFARRQLSKTEAVEAGMIPVLVALSGMFAGLTLGYFSVDQTQLQVLSISGNQIQQEYARRIIPVRKDSHLLLTTLILGNMIVNEALPVVSDKVLGGGVIAVVVSTALVVIFAEIIPQSICSRYGLLIGATMAKPVRVLMWIAFPVAWPIAKLLEYILGAHHGIIYRRSELRELIKMHAAGGEGGGDLDLDTVTMAQGALDLAGKSVQEAMTPIDQVFMLPIDAKLDYETLGHVVRSGHSRVPVYQMVEVPDVDLAHPKPGPTKTKLVKKVLGSLLVKSCVLLDPEDATPLATIPINAIPSVPCDEPLTNMLNVFQEGHSHMAIVSRRPRRRDNDIEDAESVMTAAAGGLRQRFMRKVAGIAHGDKSGSSGSEGTVTSGSESDSDVEWSGPKKEMKKTKKQSDVAKSPKTTTTSPKSPTSAQEVQEQVEAEKKRRSLANAAKLTQLEQTVPSDAQMPADLVEKFFEGLEGAPLGIITLEDVLEELIGEEIYDEYDEHGGLRNAASAFIPREAALAARKAAMDSEKTLAQATPLPPTNDADIDTLVSPAPISQSYRRIVPKLAMPKFSLGRRPASQPGRPHVPVEKPAGSTGESITPPTASTILPDETQMEESATTEVESPQRSGSATQLDGQEDIIPCRSASEKELSSRRQSSARDLSAPPAPLSSLEPASAVPARLLPGGGAATPNASPPSNANLLSEALLMERGRRRYAASQDSTPGILRVPSSIGSWSGGASPQPTPPPLGGSGATGAVTSQSKTMPPPPTTVLGQSGLISPIPVLAKRGTKFKSVPTPIPTPRIGMVEDPMEMTKVEQKDGGDKE